MGPQIERRDFLRMTSAAGVAGGILRGGRVSGRGAAGLHPGGRFQRERAEGDRKGDGDFASPAVSRSMP